MLLINLILLFAGCANPKKSQPNNSNELTVGIVQKEIRKGMSQSEVATALGSPNIVSSVGENKETWIYDKISSQVSYEQSGGYATLILLGSNSETLDITSSQKTLTIIINFIYLNFIIFKSVYEFSGYLIF